MIPQWQMELKAAKNSARSLPFSSVSGVAEVEDRYRTLVPDYYLNLINPVDPLDPIARMSLPSTQELIGGGLRDPIGDLAKSVAPRLTHRYPDRVLLHVTNLCPMFCRFCFRKNLMNEREEEMYAGDFAQAFSYLSAHPEIEEVICTGGDPWMLSDEKLSVLVDSIAGAAAGLKRLRFHTRMPVTLPSRITEELMGAVVRAGKFQTIVVTHFNHPREITAEAIAGVKKLQTAGISVLNQSVLLRGVNDSLEVMHDLLRGLGNIGVLPYYLHHCDLVAGGEHFRLPLSEGKKLWAALRGKLPGYLIPEYVLDIPGGYGKVPVTSEFVMEIAPGVYEIGFQGNRIIYRDPEGMSKILDSKIYSAVETLRR